MCFWIRSALVGLLAAVSMTAVALAQADDGTYPMDDTMPADASVAAPVMDQPRVVPTLFLKLVNPVEADVEVPLGTAQLTIQGVTLPGAVVSFEGDLVDTDEQGGFVGVIALDEGANEIEVVASDDQGNQASISIFVTRGE